MPQRSKFGIYDSSKELGYVGPREETGRSKNESRCGDVVRGGSKRKDLLLMFDVKKKIYHRSLL